MKLLITLLVLSSFNSYADKKDAEQSICLSSREYITTVRFLRDQKDFGLKDPQILKIADKVSSGCTNSSDRFVKTVKVLTKIGIDSKTAVQKGIAFSQKTDDHTKAFIEIFKYSYNPDKMDLDTLASMKIALKLSLNFDGNVKNAIKNYKELVEFCLENKSLDLSSPQCAKLSQEIVTRGKNQSKLLAPQFTKLVKFLQKNKKGPKLPLLKAIKKAKIIIGMGEAAPENFIQAFEFGTSKKGLSLSDKDALKLAEKLASRSIKTEELKRSQN